MSKKEKKPMNEKVKSAWIRSICAVLCVAIVLVGAMNIANKASDNKLTVAQTINGGSETEDGNASENGGSTDSGDVSLPDGTDDSVITDDETQKDDAGITDDNGGSTDNGSTDNGGTVTPDVTTAANNGGSGNGGSSSNTPATTKANGGSSAPRAKTTAEIIAVYNAATKKAVNAKVPFTKKRNTVEKKYEAGLALKSFKSLVYQFMGVGSGNQFSAQITKADADSYFKYLQASRLTAADVTSATIKEAGGTQTITMTLKNGSSAVSKGSVTTALNNTALDKSGIAQGEKDKDYWDHKNAENIYSAISSVAKSASIRENYSGATVTAVIANGNLKSLVVKFSFHVDIDGVMGSSGVAEAASTVTMNSFKW